MTGFLFKPLGEALDVVAHEYTHGITSFESQLIFGYEQGALNEAMSDIMAAAIDRWAGASIMDTWLVGEDVWTPNTAGDAMRSMSNPMLYGQPDYYPQRYQGPEDDGGVHVNNGIVNLAFVLMVEGGQHPRGMTTVQVPAIDSNFDNSMDIASEIFYNANTQCLTPASNFAALRFCTAEVVSESIYRDSIIAAWEAVGVCDGCGSSNTVIVLTDGIPLNDQEGQTGDVQQYILENVSAGATVTCSLAGSNGDADLYVWFGDETGPGEEDFCSSFSPISNEECTVGPAASNTNLYATIAAFEEYSGLQITCTCDGCSVQNTEAITCDTVMADAESCEMQFDDTSLCVECMVFVYDVLTPTGVLTPTNCTATKDEFCQEIASETERNFCNCHEPCYDQVALAVSCGTECEGMRCTPPTQIPTPDPFPSKEEPPTQSPTPDPFPSKEECAVALATVNACFAQCVL